MTFPVPYVPRITHRAVRVVQCFAFGARISTSLDSLARAAVITDGAEMEGGGLRDFRRTGSQRSDVTQPSAKLQRSRQGNEPRPSCGRAAIQSRTPQLKSICARLAVIEVIFR
jgi:hypothetical protein